MLVLERKVNERIRVDGPCEIVVTWIGRNRVRLGVDADMEVKITRPDAVRQERTESTGKDGGPSRQGGCGG